MDYSKLLTPNLVGSFPQDTDYIYQPLSGPFASSIDLKPDVFEVDDQLSIGSCTANATTSALELLLKRDGRGISLSRLFNYWTTRYLVEEKPGQEGATARDAIRAAKHFGVCKETTWPYDLAAVEATPPEIAFTEAIDRVIQRYEFIDARLAVLPPIGDLTQEEWTALRLRMTYDQIIYAVKSSLNEGIPVAFSCGIGQMWLGLTGPWQQHAYPLMTPDGTNRRVGGHEMVAIGYDDAVQRFLIENSWGSAWGDGGFGGMPYDSFADSLMEALVVRGFDGIYINDPLQAEWDQIQKMYLGYYGRPADHSGMLYWRNRLINEGMTAIVNAFQASPEAGALYAPERMREANQITRRG